MTLREAILKAKGTDLIVVYTDDGRGERAVEHYWNRDGVLNWDYGGSVGGLMPLGIDDPRIKDSLDKDGFEVMNSEEFKNFIR